MSKDLRKAISARLKEFIHYSELKQLAYNMAVLQQQKRFHSLAVLSFLPAEGKTLFCAATALAYAETCNSRVLVVDTTTFQNKKSLVLRDCFNGSASMVDVKSLDELRKTSLRINSPLSQGGLRASIEPALEPEIMSQKPADLQISRENDFSLIKKAAEDPSHQYGLVLIDTAPLRAKNRSNIDPLLVARLTDASVLMVSRKFLDSHDMNASLKAIEDPNLHLIGVISNEVVG